MNSSLIPFIEIAKSIPDNWPDKCVLRFDYENGRMVLSYYGINDVKEGITIGEWKSLLRNEPKS